ncbi:hypothetical protein [Kocuria sabuli]|uniref:hypothetical protein n=1 Tax=Kocuria sabuli TaxID=3071448 RepID=UPI0034D3F1A3
MGHPEEREDTDRQITVHHQTHHHQTHHDQRGSRSWNRDQRSVIGFSRTLRHQERTEQQHPLGHQAHRWAHHQTQLTEQPTRPRARAQAEQHPQDTQ